MAARWWPRQGDADKVRPGASIDKAGSARIQSEPFEQALDRILALAGGLSPAYSLSSVVRPARTEGDPDHQ